MTCRVCGFRNLDSRATCRRCGAALAATLDKTLGGDADDDTGLVLELDERDIEPRPAPPSGQTAPRPDPAAEALRARALTAGDRDPRHLAARESAERPAPYAPPAPPAPPRTVPEPPVPPAGHAPPLSPASPAPARPAPVEPPAAPAEPPSPPPAAGHTLDLDAPPYGGPGDVRPAAAPRPRPFATDTVAGMRRWPPAAPPPAAASPAPAATTEPEYAGFWVRLLAMIVDWTIILAVLIGTSIATLLLLGGPGAVIDPAGATENLQNLRAYFAAFELALLAVYFVFFTWAAGGTPGKLVLRLKVVSVDGRPVTGGRAFLRFLGYGLEIVPGVIVATMLAAVVAVGSLVLQQPLLTGALGVLAMFLVFVGYIWAAFDPRKQAWHDKLAGTVVVRAP